MIRVVVLVRAVGRLRPDSWLQFDLPDVPQPGSYISIYRGDPPETHSEDMVVEKVWWRLKHPETGAYGSNPPLIGSPIEIMVECTQAIGPHSNDRWRDGLEAARASGIDVPEFEIDRFSVRQNAFSKKS